MKSFKVRLLKSDEGLAPLIRRGLK